MIKKLLVFLFSFCMVFGCITKSVAQEETEKDSVVTAFRKGRWLSGFSGSISSGSTKSTSAEDKSINNRYRIEVSSGKFIKDRLNLGFNVFLERENFEGDELRTSEDFVIGPKGTYYLSKSNIGSLFFSFSPGLILYRDKTVLIQDTDFIEIVNKGSGFGTISTFGYSYIIRDFVAFDLGLNWSAYRINITQSTSQGYENGDTNIILNDLSFSFGFKIFLGL